MFTSVTKNTLLKASSLYIALTLFLILFTFIYEHFSYGESSIFMRSMFLSPMIAAGVFWLASYQLGWIKNRASLLLFNSSIAILVSAGLIKGIVEVSGRHTSVDQPYWYVAGVFALLSLILGFVPPKKNDS
ncbi:hypothetical protein GRB29_03460 [Streptococcus pneumoniae]|nr:hypothetical protein [Streptococcus pneumoniae]